MIGVYCDRPGRAPQEQWLWAAKGDPNVKPEHHRLFGVPDECKPRKDGKLILMNDSCGGFAGLDVMTGRCAFYGNAGGNPHSVELLPDGKGGYYFTNHAAVWHFDPATESFTKARGVSNVKSFSPSRDGDLMAIPRESWWTDTLLVYPHGSSDASAAREITLPGAKFYKARWM